MSKVKLLFITQKIHQHDDDLAFVILWIKEFIRQGVDVQVICLEKGESDDSFPVYSLGKEKGYGKIRRSLLFLKYIFTLKYNRVFVHMNPEYVTLGGWYWWLRRIPVYLWYTHYTMHMHLWLSGILCKRLFAATSQSLPQYEGNPKKVITGHGIDMSYWLTERTQQPETTRPIHNLVAIHRLCRSKRLELGISALTYLPHEYTLAVYGRDVEKDYVQEMTALVAREGLSSRVVFQGPRPMAELKNIYPQYRVMVNMASETIDKTMLEAMVFGIYPVTTPANSQAIGLPLWPQEESPQAIAEFIHRGEWQKYSGEFLQAIVRERHSLPSLISKMLKYVISGT